MKGSYEYLLNKYADGNWHLESSAPTPVEPEEFIPVMPVLPTVPPKPVDPVDPVEPEELIPVMPVLPTVPPKPVDPVDPKEPVQPKAPVIRPEAGSYAFNAKMAKHFHTSLRRSCWGEYIYQHE